MSLEVTTSTKGLDVLVTLTGYLDENCVLPDFNDEIEGKMIVDLEGLTMINSLGSRRWLKWVKSIRAVEGVVLTRCSSPFITQVNILHNFLPAGVRVESFQVPYMCTKCTNEHNYLFQVETDSEVAEERPCPHCGGKAELEVLKAKYFHFLKQKAG